MMLRLVAVSVFVAATAAAATAHAQAPGDFAGDGMGPSTVAPIVVGDPCSCGGRHTDVMANRWAVGLSVGSLSLAQRDTGNDPTSFSVGELSLRYRATLHLELEAVVGGGNEKNQDGSPGSRQVNLGAIDVRYRFRPRARWSWWLMGGLGGLSVTDRGASDQDRHDAQRPFEQVGVGVERRFRRFALHAELSVLSIGPMQDAPVAQPAATTGPGVAAAIVSTGQPPPPSMTTVDNLVGGQLTIGASYYF